MIKLIAADMDGTLLDSRKRMSPGLVPCVRELAQRGVRFAVASGRQYFMLLEDLKKIAEEIIIIAENGAVIYDRGKRIYVNALKPELIREPVEAVRGIENAGVVICGADSAYIEDENPEFIRNVNMYYARCQSVPDVLEGYGEDQVCKLAFFDLEGAEHHSYPHLVQFSDRFTVCLSGDHWVDFMEPGVNKGSALKALQELYGIAPSECMAFGDYMNDAEMMEACEYSYAMENAHPDLKKLCRYRAPSNDEDGVVRTIRQELGLNRCPWVKSELDADYHDREWGMPSFDDAHLFEMLILEGMQAGLSWSLILKKRKHMREVFDGFDPVKIADWGEDKLLELMGDPGVIRNRRKLEAARVNARCFLETQKEFGTFSRYLWGFVDGKPIVNHFERMEEVPAFTELSDRLSKDLKKRGFKFVGSTICYSLMQSVGMVNDHLTGCGWHQACQEAERGKAD